MLRAVKHNAMRGTAGRTMLAAIALVSASLASTPAAAQAPLATTAVVGGRPAAEGQFPFVAAVLDSRSVRPDGLICGGSLIAPTVVLTAAHCVVDPATGDVEAAGFKRVALGRNDLRSGAGEVIDVASISMHPSYDDRTLFHDVALLELSRASSAPVVALGDARAALREGQRGVVAGWGDVRSGGPGSPVLLTARLPLWSNQRCAGAYPREHEPGLMLCAAARRAGRDVCRGDSGGPLLAPDASGTPRLVGVVSFGRGCALPGLPTNFAWAASPHLRGWILRRSAALERDDSDTVRPRIDGLAARGGIVRYSLSEPAEVVFTVRRRAGRRLVTLSTVLVHAGRSGANGFRMPAALRGRRLRPGMHRLRAIATDSAGNLSRAVHVNVPVR